MSEKVNRCFDRDFKVGAVKMIMEEERSVVDVSQSLGVSTGSLYTWMRQFKTDGGNAFPGSGKLKVQDEELRQLRAELRRVTMERDILKKTMGYFVERPK